MMARLQKREKRKRVGQSAMEYLMTYGWAILVIVIVAAVLIYMGILNPRGTAPNAVVFAPGYSAYSFRLGNGTGALELDFGHATGGTIEVTAVGCSSQDSPTLTQLTEPVYVPNGDHRWITGGNSGNALQCLNESGGVLRSSFTETGSRYRGNLCVQYVEMDTGTSRTTCGTINGRFEPGYTQQGQGTPTPSATETPTATPTQTATPTPTPTPTPAPYLITSCGTYNSLHSYYMGGPLTASDGHCLLFTAGASGSTLDCQGNTLTGNPESENTGIRLEHVSGFTVTNCNPTNFYYGIMLLGSSNNQIIGNTANQNSEMGIYLYGSSNNNVVTGNTANSNGDRGIALYSSDDNSMTGNTANSNRLGIFLQGSNSGNIVTGNTANSNTDIGISIGSGTTGASISGNTACDNPDGDISCAASQSGSGNTCDSLSCGGVTCSQTCQQQGQDVIAHPTIITAGGTYTIDPSLDCTTGLVQCNGQLACICVLGTADVTISCGGNDIGGDGNNLGIYFVDSPGGRVENCNVHDFYNGVLTQNSASMVATGNTVSGMGADGIRLEGSSNAQISGNTISACRCQGITVEYADGATIQGNTISQCGIDSCPGIIIRGNNAVVSQNDLLNNRYGIMLNEAHDSQITSNTITGTTQAGILIADDSAGNTLTGNVVTGSGQFGVRINPDSTGSNTYASNTVTGSTQYDFVCYAPTLNTDNDGNTCGTENCDWLTCQQQ